MLVMVIAFLTIACTPTVTSKVVPPEPEPEPTTTTAPATNAEGDLLPPIREDSSLVASDVLTPVATFSETFDPPQTTEDLLVAIEAWLPRDLVAGEAQTVYEDADGATVAVVSVIPQLTWRGDPGFVASLIVALTGAEPDNPQDSIFTANTVGGAVMNLWSTGDGFVVAASHDPEAAVNYLLGLAQIAEPNESWASGDCLFINEEEDMPYAPFPPDVVVPCSGAHNAEVLFGSTTGAELESFDEEAIEYQRNLDCDRSYNEVFGDQRTHAPGDRKSVV
jgi:hypothetical protein